MEQLARIGVKGEKTVAEKYDGLTILGSLPSMFGIFATVSFVLSVVYDWAYLRSLGLSFSAIPTSIADHARSALVWGPSVGIGLFMFLIVSLVTSRIEEGMTEHEIIDSSHTPELSR